MALEGPNTRERRDGDLSVGLACCPQVSDPRLDRGELVLQPPPTADAVLLAARLSRLDWRPEPYEHRASGSSATADMSPTDSSAARSRSPSARAYPVCP
jgi:hypothetical protein